MVGESSLSLFRAFLLNWIVGLNAPFEVFLENLGEKQDVNVSLVKFDSTKPKAIMAVPSIHPGPFKNVGSSVLPALLKTALERESEYIACVPSGLQSHELDLASQLQNQNVISAIIAHMNFRTTETKATQFTEIRAGLAIACCQVFGNFAILSFTLSPNTTEDLPQELGMFVKRESEKNGLAHCVVINAHNSIDGEVQTESALESLREAAATCLKKAASLEQLPFQVGAFSVKPPELSLRDGMGDGGITVIVVKVGDQKNAYVVIDGNNMVSGLREKILLALNSIGIDNGEVYTTDTHSVSAIILGKRGYHPIGEVIDHDRLIDYIKKATLNALSHLDVAKASCLNVTVPEIKVIGERRLETLSSLIDKALQRARIIAAPLFVFTGLILMLFLLFV